MRGTRAQTDPQRGGARSSEAATIGESARKVGRPIGVRALVRAKGVNVAESISKNRGQLTELTHLVPIRAGLVPANEWGTKGLSPSSFANRLALILRGFDDREDKGFPSVIRLFRQIHSAKWLQLDGGTRLLLSVVFDGDWSDYMRGLAREVPAMLHLVWSNTVGWERNFTSLPAAQRSESLMHFIKTHQVAVSFLYLHHPHHTVRDIGRLVSAESNEPRERAIARELESVAQRRERALRDYGRVHSLGHAKDAFCSLLEPRYDACAFKCAFKETFGEEHGGLR